MADDVHLMNAELKFGNDPNSKRPGFGYFETNCGKRVNEESLVLTDDPKSVTCSKCNEKMGTRKTAKK